VTTHGLLDTLHSRSVLKESNDEACHTISGVAYEKAQQRGMIQTSLSCVSL
jgi:hypothetical protein